MVSGIFVLIITFFLAQVFHNRYQDRLRHSRAVFNGLFFYHLVLFVAYYVYGKLTASDSHAYYRSVAEYWKGDSIWEYYGTSTRFIEFFAYPFINGLGLSYEGIMLVFSFLGYLGFFFLYLFIVESTRYRHRLWGYDFILILMFLPNMHFWTVSLGKGSIIFFGMSLFFYGLNKYSTRIIPLLLGAVVIFHVRPHILFLILGGLAGTLVISSRGLSWVQKFALLLVTAGAAFMLLDDALQVAGLEEASLEEFNQFAEARSSELTKATSGIEIQDYNHFQKLFAFWFRPLFVDAPNILGILVSFENLLYLFLFLKICSLSFLRYLFGAHWMVKSAFFIFFIASFALAQLSGNLGLAIRQKSQVMFLFFFVFLTYADYRYSREGKAIIGE